MNCKQPAWRSRRSNSLRRSPRRGRYLLRLAVCCSGLPHFTKLAFQSATLTTTGTASTLRQTPTCRASREQRKRPLPQSFGCIENESLGIESQSLKKAHATAFGILHCYYVLPSTYIEHETPVSIDDLAASGMPDGLTIRLPSAGAIQHPLTMADLALETKQWTRMGRTLNVLVESPNQQSAP